MARKFITKLSSRTGNHTARVYRDDRRGEFRSVFYTQGVRHQGADAQTSSEFQAILETNVSLAVADELCALSVAAQGRHVAAHLAG